MPKDNSLFERVSFKNHKKQQLTGDLYLPENDIKGGVVFGHCFTCSRHTRVLQQACQDLYERDIAALRFDFSGNGQSEGDFAETTYSKHMTEMKLAMSFLKDYGIENIGLAGHSMGAAVSLLTAASTSEAKAVCTLAGRYSELNVPGLLDDKKKNQLKQTGQIDFQSRGRELILTQDFFQDVASHDLAGIVAELTVPLLAIHGDQDEIIPVSEVYEAEKLKPENTQIEVIEGADHMFSQEDHRKHVSQLLADWFQEQLSG